MTALSVQSPYPIFTDIDGQPLEDGYVWIGTANLDPQTNPINVYWDKALTLLAPQPIRTLAGYPANSGTPARLYVNGDDYSIRVMNKNGSTLYSAANKTEAIGDIPSNLVTFIQPFSGSVTRTVQSKLRDTVSIFDFLTTVEIADVQSNTGSVDLTLKIRNAVTQCAGMQLFFPEGTYLVTAQVEVPAFTTVAGEGVRTVFKMSNPNSSLFETITQSYVTFENFNIECALTGTTPYVAGIRLFQTVYSLVQNVRMSGLSHFGVLLQDSNNNVVRGCEFFNWRGTIQDSTDIICRDDSNFNIIEGNHCYSGGDVGISIFDPYSGSTPTGNVIANNVVGAHMAYGIMAYVTTLYDTQTIIDGNNIRDIDGRGNFGSGVFGSGIYIQSAAGTVCSNNKITNCCINTTNFGTLAPAGIGITNILSDSPVICVGNSIARMTKGPGIMCNTSTNVIISDNSINIANNSGVGTNGQGIYIVDVARLNISNNNIKQGTAGYWGINIVSGDVAGIDATIVEGNNVLSSGYGLGFNNVAGGTFLRTTVSDNVIDSTDITFFAGLSNDMNVTGNHFLNGTGGAFNVSSVTKTRLVNNTMVTNSGVYSIALQGTGSRNLIDETNYFNAGSSGTVLNDATSGFIVSQYGNAGPSASGTWAVGDRVIQSVPVVGQPKGWRCTVAGNPGTWVSEGNL